MVKRFLFLLTLLIGLIYASIDRDKIEILAKSVDATKNIIKATDGVVIYYEESIIKASSVYFNKDKKLLIIDGNIEIIGYKGSKEHAQHLEIKTDTKEVKFDKLFLIGKNDIWLFSDKGERKKEKYSLKSSLLSSCDINNPTWKMSFSNSLYDTKENYIEMYNTKVYLWDIPIFYTPYLAFPTNRDRTSGVLFPSIGYKSSEGFIYEQPIYWAISPSMDLEFNPQIRTERSIGIYSSFRFADSLYSSGEIRFGYFRDHDSYFKDHNLTDNAHYGVEFNYQSSNLFKKFLPENFKDGLYINSTILNDIDYLNLQKSGLKHFGATPLQESRVNYFAYNNDYYFGLNTKYFIDTRKEHNDDTIQILPSLNIHKNLKSFLIDNLTYSANLNISNFDRKDKITMHQAKLKIPIELTTSFFEEYISLSFKETFYYNKFFFGNGNYIYDDFEYYSATHQIKIFTDLTKQYSNFTHILQPSLLYTKAEVENQSPIDFSVLSDEQKSLFTIESLEEHYDFTLSQYFYDENMKLKFSHKLSQQYYVNRAYKFADTINEIKYNFKTLNIYSNIIYSNEFKKIRELSNNISLYKKNYYLTLGHIYKKSLPDQPNSVEADNINFSFEYSINDKLKINGTILYNFDDSSSRQWRLGGSYNLDCWSISSSIREEITPRPTGFSSDTTFYLQLNFKPFGSIGTGN